MIKIDVYKRQTNLSAQVVQEVKKYFGSKVYSTVIPRNIRLAEAPSYGMAITEYDPKSKGAEAYMDFADEFLAVSYTHLSSKFVLPWALLPRIKFVVLLKFIFNFL